MSTLSDFVVFDAGNFPALLRDWREDTVTFLHHDMPKLVIIVVGALVLSRLLRVMVRRIAALQEKKLPSGIRAQKIRTMASVITSVGVFVIFFWAVLQALPLFGLNIAPLLASAGIAGLAIGFGAQTLVKDVINGFFILVENQFEVGDQIRASGVQGTVEEITMRRTLLRDADGTLHIVPNSNIQIVSNMTRDWSQVSLHVSVDYSEESDRVMRLLQEIGKEFYNDPAFHEDLVAELEVPGIDRVTGHA